MLSRNQKAVYLFIRKGEYRATPMKVSRRNGVCSCTKLSTRLRGVSNEIVCHRNATVRVVNIPVISDARVSAISRDNRATFSFSDPTFEEP
jgi:hypothetical protein